MILKKVLKLKRFYYFPKKSNNVTLLDLRYDFLPVIKEYGKYLNFPYSPICIYNIVILAFVSY
jgi:hypothetical protein